MYSNPLVSIVVMTYNSSKYVIETLDSAYNQTYPNIELIVTDDCSSDDTAKLVDIWMENHRDRFVSCQLIQSSVNTGIPANLNRGIRSCKGEWVKSIAGDDILLPKCVEHLIIFTKENTNAEIVIGLIKPFYILSGKKIYKKILPRKLKRYIFSKDSFFQYQYLLERSINFAPGAFIRCGLFERVGYYDENYKMIEDLPFWLKATKKGVRIEILKKPCVQYRTEHESAVFSQKYIFNKRFYDCFYNFHRKVIWKEVPWWRFSYYETIFVDMFLYYIGINLFHNKRTRLYDFISGMLKYLRCALYYDNIIDLYYSKKNKHDTKC